MLLDSLAMIMITLVLFIGICIGSFAYRYMKGDTTYHFFFIRFILLICSTLCMVAADHIIILCLTWFTSNAILVKMIMHKSNWKAAYASAMIAAKNYAIGALLIVAGLFILYVATQECSIKKIIVHSNATSLWTQLSLILLLIGAMAQSAIVPFHRWLISSVNAPTPVSAIMHAGLINGGGFLLVRFGALYLKHPVVLDLMFIIGIITAMIGTLWKLMQSDVKRMLACSTIGQMGFMFAQCGMGLFPAAMAHVVCHGMFKSYLFLATGSAAYDQRVPLHFKMTPFVWIAALICGVVGSLSFGLVTKKSFYPSDTTFVLICVCFMAATQTALTILSSKTFKSLPLVMIAIAFMGMCYGYIIRCITQWMEPLQQPQPFTFIHAIAVIVMCISWIAMLCFKYRKQMLGIKGYVVALNASQPHPDSVTTSRKQYHYV